MIDSHRLITDWICIAIETEGAENFKKVATDKRSLADVTAMVKKANSKLHELQVTHWQFTFGNSFDWCQTARNYAN